MSKFYKVKFPTNYDNCVIVYMKIIENLSISNWKDIIYRIKGVKDVYNNEAKDIHIFTISFDSEKNIDNFKDMLSKYGIHRNRGVFTKQASVCLDDTFRIECFKYGHYSKKWNLEFCIKSFVENCPKVILGNPNKKRYNSNNELVITKKRR